MITLVVFIPAAHAATCKSAQTLSARKVLICAALPSFTASQQLINPLKCISAEHEASLPASSEDGARSNQITRQTEGREAAVITFKVLFITLQFDYSISTSIKSLTTTALRATFFNFFLLFCKSIAITDLRPKTYYITIA